MVVCGRGNTRFANTLVCYLYGTSIRGGKTQIDTAWYGFVQPGDFDCI